MKKLFYLIIFSICFSTMLFAQKTIKITNGEWEPFLSQYSYGYGIDSHIITEALKLEGIKVKWAFYPWKRAYQLAKKGTKWDASCCWWPSEETKEAFLLSDVVSKTSFVFYHLKSYNFDWSSLDDLKNIRIGGTLEYDYGKKFTKAMKDKKIRVDLVPTDETNYKKLLKGRIKIFPNDPVVGYAQIRNNFTPEEVKKFTHHSKEFEVSTLHLIISKKSKNAKFFMDKFNSGLKKLKKSGRLDKMFKDLAAGKYDKKKTKWKE